MSMTRASWPLTDPDRGLETAFKCPDGKRVQNRLSYSTLGKTSNTPPAVAL